MTARSTSACSTAGSWRSTPTPARWCGRCKPRRPNSDYTITGAPRIIKGKVVIGQGGAEYGVRGFLGAYDAQTGKLAWKFYVIPGDPSKPFEDEALAVAAKTWNGQWWKYGGGGTPWDGIAYDPELNLRLRRHRQRIAVERAPSQPRRRRQPLPGVDRRAQRRHRQVRLALPDDAGRQLGLQRRAADDPRRPDHRQPAAQGDHAGAEERLLLRARSRHRQADLGRAVRVHVVGDGRSTRRRDVRSKPRKRAIATRPCACRRRRLARTTGRRWRSTRSPSWSTTRARKPAPSSRWRRSSSSRKGSGTSACAAAPAPFRRRRRRRSEGAATGRILRRLGSGRATSRRGKFRSTPSGGALSTAGQLIFVGNSAGKFFALDPLSGKTLWESQLLQGVATPISYELDGKQYIAVMSGISQGPGVRLRARC